jgi:hypothetical protein
MFVLCRIGCEPHYASVGRRNVVYCPTWNPFRSLEYHEYTPAPHWIGERNEHKMGAVAPRQVYAAIQTVQGFFAQFWL